MTQYPTELLWGPGPWAELVAVLGRFDDQTPTDAVTFLDRLFFIRVVGSESQPEFPRSAADVVALELDDDTAAWYAVRADFPLDAWAQIRDRDHSADVDRQRHASILRRLIGDRKTRQYAKKARSS